MLGRWEFHQLFAEVVVWALATAAREAAPRRAAAPGPYHKPADLAKFATCGNGTYHSAFGAYRGPCDRAPGVAAAAGCVVAEDRPGKPAYVLRGANAHVAFAADFLSESPTLSVSYVRSYENVGTATLSLNGARYDLEGLRTDSRTTQTHSEFFNVALPKSLDQTTSTSVAEAKRMGRPLGDAGAKGFGVRAGTRHLPLTIRLAAGAPKFGLVSVAAC